MGISTQFLPTPTIPNLEGTLNYIRLRRCKNGGYCFYRLEEPNCADTYFALASLHLIDRASPDRETADFLLARQRPDGSYESISQAYFSLGGLRLLKKNPRYDPRTYLFNRFTIYDISLLPPGTVSIFEPLYHLVHMYRWLGIDLPEGEKGRLISFVLREQKGDGGFGRARATLIETRDALFILAYLGATFDTGKVESFLRSCQDRIHGFVNLPGIRFSYLEHIHAGLEMCRFLSLSPAYPETIFDFLQACRKVNGGYSRSTHTGIASLENTFYALSSFQLLSSFWP